MAARRLTRELPLHLMLLPGLILVLIFCYVPMAGIVIAFQKFVPARGLFGSQTWVGLGNFTFALGVPGFPRVLWNTVYIAVLKMAGNLLVPIVFAILINELRSKPFRRGVQTIISFPHFVSWIILGGVLLDILSPSEGVVNRIIKALGMKPVFFLGDNRWFPLTMVFTDILKEFGFGTIVYLAAITSIDEQLYEAARIDGANRLQQIVHITLPGMAMVIVLLGVLSLGNVLNAGFDQIFNLYNPTVYESGDILDTLVYRTGIIDFQYGLATAVGFFKSVVSLLFIATSYFLAYRFAGYRIF